MRSGNRDEAGSMPLGSERVSELSASGRRRLRWIEGRRETNVIHHVEQSFGGNILRVMTDKEISR